MKTTQMCLLIFTLLASAWGPALADDGINGSENGSGADVLLSPDILNLEGIWTFSLGASDAITAVLYQSEKLIWGEARSEKPEPMNGVLSGSISGDQVEIRSISAAGNILTVTGMRGAVTGETVRGSYFRIDSFGAANSGSFAGMRTSTDTAGYASLDAAQSEPSVQEAAVSSETSQSTEAEVQPQTETVNETKDGYADVHQLSSGINPRILGYAAPVTGKSRIV